MEKIKCKLCGVRYVLQQEWKKKFEKSHCATCYAFLKTLNNYEKALQELMETCRIQNMRIKIYLEKNDASTKLAESIFGKKQYE